MTSTIVHPTDFSEHSAAALRFASALAMQQGARLVVVHVALPAEPPTIAVGGVMGAYPPPGAMIPAAASELSFGHAQLEAELAAVMPAESGVPVEHRLTEGDPAEEIVKLAKETAAAQIIMGSHGRRGLSRMLMGSVAESVLRRAECPVTIVKAPAALDE